MPNCILQWEPTILLFFDYLRVKKSPFINSGDITVQTILQFNLLTAFGTNITW